MGFVRAVAFVIASQIWSLGLGIVALPMLLLSKRRVRSVGRLWGRGLIFLAGAICGVRHARRNWHLIDDGKPKIVAMKHQSAYETMLAIDVGKDPSIVLKEELTRMPLYGFFFGRAGMIVVRRQAGAAAMRALLRQARQVRDEGRTIVIYPEGTRTAIGQAPRYQPGVAALYGDLGLPVVPVALNSGLFWRHRRFVKIPGTVVLEAMEPIEAGLDRRVFLKELEARLEAGTARLVAEGQNIKRTND